MEENQDEPRDWVSLVGAVALLGMTAAAGLVYHYWTKIQELINQ